MENTLCDHCQKKEEMPILMVYNLREQRRPVICNDCIGGDLPPITVKKSEKTEIESPLIKVLVMDIDGSARIQLINSSPNAIREIIGDDIELLSREDCYEEQFSVFVGENAKPKRLPINIMGTEMLHGLHVAKDFGIHGVIVITGTTVTSVSQENVLSDVPDTLLKGVAKCYEDQFYDVQSEQERQSKKTKHSKPTVLPNIPEPVSEEDYRRRLADFVGMEEADRVTKIQFI